MIIIPANTLSTRAYEVANSCKFDRASSAYMDKSSGTSSSNDIYTLSFYYYHFHLYNKTLSDNEVAQNYKALKSRFNL